MATAGVKAPEPAHGPLNVKRTAGALKLHKCKSRPHTRTKRAPATIPALLSTANNGNERPSSTKADGQDSKDQDGTDSEKGQDGKEEGKDEKNREKITNVTNFTIDPAGPSTHDETTVDVVTVPCPGGHPIKSWNRDGLMGRFFGAPSMRDAEIRDAERPGPSWVRQGIRREADRARILLYEHPASIPGTTLNKLAVALLENLRKLRVEEEGLERPLLFITHSVGGLVVKMALVRASRDPKYEGILRNCYGIAFFGTPHQGSSYFSKLSLAPSIQSLLHLTAPIPPSLAAELRMGNRLLLHIDEDFKDISDGVHVWTFYETIDSRLSAGLSGDVYFMAPLTSIKSAILGMRQERVFPLESDHANLASFGRHNVHTLKLFLRQLASQIDRADLDSKEGAEAGHRILNLEQKVHVEVHGFFREAAEDVTDGTIRAWSTRLPLRDFLKKGPEECLSERLNEADDAPEESRFLINRGRTSVVELDISPSPVIAPAMAYSPAYSPKVMTVKNALGIRQRLPSQAHQGASIPMLSLPASPVIHPVDFRRESAPTTFTRPVSDTLAPLSRPISPQSRHSTPLRRPSPMRFDLDQEVAINRLSPPLRGRQGRPFGRSMSLDHEAEAASPPRFRDFPPFSKRSRSAFDGAISVEETDDEEGLDASPQLPEPLLSSRRFARDKRHVSESAVFDTLVAFVKPQVEARKFVWIHLPFNNPTWVSNILQTLQNSYNRDFSALSNHDFWMTRHTRGRHPQPHAYFARPGFYFTAPRTLSPRMRAHASPKSPTLLPASSDDAIYTCLFIPYLHFDTYKKMLRRRDFIQSRMNHRRAHPIPESVTKVESLELQVIWEFLGHDPPINCRRTLDQFGYPSLRDTRSRDDDQMLYKLTKERDCTFGRHRGIHGYDSSFSSGPDGSVNNNVSGNQDGGGGGSGMGNWRQRLSRWETKDGSEISQAEILDGNVLMVDQLWLWTISSHTLLTFFPKRESDPIEGPLYQQADLRDSIFNDINVDLTRQCDNALDLAALAALHAVTVLLDRASHPNLEIFRIFEEAISVLTEKLTTSLKEFRSEGFRDKAQVFESIQDKAHGMGANFRDDEASWTERENRDNTSAMLELRDIEDELQMLLHLFEQQSKVISCMHSNYSRPEMKDQTIHGRVFLSEALKRLSEYTHLAEDMVHRVRSTRDDFDKLLQMMQRQAQVDEVRLSRLHADLASAQSRSVLIFTTFTVIFLPLQFFTGLFGMNTREWGGGQFPSIKTIGEIALPSSALLILATLLIAWSTTVRSLFRWLGRLYNKALRWLYVVAGRPVARRIVRMMVTGTVKAQQGRMDARGEGSGGGGVSRETSDFWEKHRAERERGYEIPEANKAVRARSQNEGRESRRRRRFVEKNVDGNIWDM